jgi:hypothetical protein
MKRAIHCLFLVIVSCHFVRSEGITPELLVRQGSAISAVPPPPQTTVSAPVQTPSKPPLPTVASPTADPPTTQAPQQPTTTQALPTQPTSAAAPATTDAPVTSDTPVTLPPQTTSFQTTDAAGSTSLVIVTNPATTEASQTSSSAAPQTSSSGGKGGLGTGPIVGLSVAGGVAVLGVIGFIVWKFSKKRFSDFDDSKSIFDI